MYEDTHVTDINNMLSLYAARPQTPQQQAISGQKMPALSDFAGLLLTPQTTPPDAATLQNMPDNLKALAEKIAALLNGTAVAGDGAAIADADFSAIPGTLTRDLSAALAGTLQNGPAGDPSGTGAATLSASPEIAVPDEGPFPLPAAPDAAAAGTPNILPQTTDAQAIAAEAEMAAEMTAPQNAAFLSAKAVVSAAFPPVVPETAALSSAAPLVPAGDVPALPWAAVTAAEAGSQIKGQASPAPAATPAPAAQSVQPIPALHTAVKAEASLNTLLAAMTLQNGANAESGFDGAGTGFGQNGFSGGFAGGEAAAGNLAMSSGAQQPAFAQYMPTAGQSLPAQSGQMIALQIQRNAAAKIDTFTLQLEPADLGRLDIELKFGHDGSLKAHLTVERPETLAMLQKDAAYLERLLQQSGLNTDGQSLSFDLRQHGNGQDKRGLPAGTQNTGGDAAGAPETNDGKETILHGYIGPRGVNIMV
jgi:flagellar hook-length control protein FliK